MSLGSMLINTSRGGLLDTRAAIAALKSGHLGALGIDVYEEEGALFFEDLSGTVLRDADIVSLHVPLTPATHHLIDAAALAQMKRGVMLINTGRGALIDSRAMLQALKSGQLGAAGLDVYEEEEGVFFQDLSGQVLQDDVLARLLTFPNVLVTAHQGFLTREALRAIAQTTLGSVQRFERGEPLGPTEVRAEQVLKR